MIGSRLRQVTLVTGIVLGAFSSGCGKGDELVLGDVTGTVLLDGTPLENAKVEFNPIAPAEPTKKGKAASGGSLAITDKDGKYRLSFNARRKGAVLGEHSVRITTAGQQEVPDGQLPKPEKVPPSYNLQSQLKFNVQKGPNHADFNLTGTVSKKR